MRSRADRYKSESTSLNESRLSRSTKNQDLYNNLGSNTRFTNLDEITRSNAVDINKARRNSSTRAGYQQMKECGSIVKPPKSKKQLDDFNFLYQDHENRVYDINRVLKQARENRGDSEEEKEEKRKLKNTNYNILASLNPKELEKYKREKQEKNKPNEKELRSLIDTITSKTLAGEISKEATIDLLSDLMATNVLDKVEPSKTMSTKKIEKTQVKPSEKTSKDILDKEGLKKVEQAKKEMKQSTTSDIMKGIDKSFYTKSMDLSDKDFFFGDEEAEKKVPLILKILLIIILVAIVLVGAFFIYKTVQS